MITRRSVLCGLIAAPIVVRQGLVMQVKMARRVISNAVTIDIYGDTWMIKQLTIKGRADHMKFLTLEPSDPWPRNVLETAVYEA